MSASSETPRPSSHRRPEPQVSRRESTPDPVAPRVEETSPAPLGFEALLREINTVVELLERIDGALEAHGDAIADDAASLSSESDPAS